MNNYEYYGNNDWRDYLTHQTLSCNEYYGNNDWRDYLAHHGVKGQKWGVRNGPPYPLSSEISTGKMLKSITITRGHKWEGQRKSGSEVLSNPNDRNVQEVEERVYPDGRIAYFPPATIIKDFEAIGKNPYEGPKGFDGLYKRVNPGFHGYHSEETEPGTTNNCPFVGAAMQVASMGYDVVAGKSLGGASADAFERWFKGAELMECKDFDDMESDFLEFGNGSSGVMQGYYGSGLGDNKGGHTLHWRVEDDEVIVADGQNGTEWSFGDIVKQYGFGESGCLYTRLDDCEPNWNAMAEDGVIAVNNSARRYKNKNTGGIYSKF